MDFYEILFRGIPKSGEVYPPRERGDAWWAYARDKYFKHSYPSDSGTQHSSPPQPAEESTQPVVATASAPAVAREKEEPSTPPRVAAVAPAPPPATSAHTTASAPRRPTGFKYRAFRTVPHAMENLREGLQTARKVFAPYLERFNATIHDGVRQYAARATLDALWREMLAKDPSSEKGGRSVAHKFRAAAEDVQIRLEQAEKAHRDAAVAAEKTDGAYTERQAWEMSRARLLCERILALAPLAETQADACEELVEELNAAIMLLRPRGEQSREASERPQEPGKEGEQGAVGSVGAGGTGEADGSQGPGAWSQP